MKKLPLTATLLALAVLFLCNPAKAQYDYIKQGYQSQSYLPYSLHRVQVGVSLVNAAADFTGYLDANLPNGETFSKYYNEPLTSQGGFGLTAGTFYRIATIGKRVAIATDIDLMYNSIYWNNIGRNRYPDKDWDHEAKSNQFALPLGLSVKIGSDARLEKNHRFCMSFGGGYMPAYTITRLKTDEDKDKQPKYKSFAGTPFIKAEAGFFAGLCFKLRFLWTVGNYKLVEDAATWKKEESYGYNHMDIKGRSTFVVSFIIMPFSYDWPDNGWWNNSRTSRTFYPWR